MAEPTMELANYTVARRVYRSRIWVPYGTHERFTVAHVLTRTDVDFTLFHPEVEKPSGMGDRQRAIAHDLEHQLRPAVRAALEAAGWAFDRDCIGWTQPPHIWRQLLGTVQDGGW